MRRLSRFLHLPPERRRLLIHAVFLLAGIRLGLRVLPFARLRSLLARGGKTASGGDRSGDIDGIVGAVEAAGRHVPLLSTCLTRAMAAQVLLARAGIQSNLRIGVARNANGQFLAHAWLEKDGVTLTGQLTGDDAHVSYVPMPALSGLER